LHNKIQLKVQGNNVGRWLSGANNLAGFIGQERKTRCKGIKKAAYSENGSRHF
jgi:hypothetical protein